MSTEVILVVEDERGVRSAITRMLRNLGYFVLEAINGEEALHVMQEYHAPIHLVITDIVMPEMNGAQLVTLLRDWFPRMRVVFISGYGADYLEEKVGALPGATFLPKPFSFEELAKRVRESLDAEWTVE